MERTKTVKTYSGAPSYSIAEEVLKKRVAAVIPADTISFISTRTEIVGETKYFTLDVRIVTEKLPDNDISFSRLADNVREAVESGIKDIEDYRKMTIEVHVSDDIEKAITNRSYKKEINL
ncbi:hypothetical protein [Salinimicrobium sp. HB62]|uniref:hypothetical protein n=1 Tax=Salinimicrobium sp. HB62 TaxID=3077781 RepID=UPI002D785C08|nr:hypothetical protein [Salinimicrobium sp. HB62]